MQPVEQQPAGVIGQRLEDRIHGFDDWQPKGCMSSVTREIAPKSRNSLALAAT
jgi:hypothetical protein